MPDEERRKERRKVLDRADRMLKQSKILRKLSDELLKESKDIRAAMENVRPKPRKRG